MTPWLVLYASLINWIVTYIATDSKLTEPVRSWIIREASVIRARGVIQHVGNRHAYVWPEDATQEEADAAEVFLHGPWAKLAQLVTCPLCIGTWIGFAEATVLGGPFHGWYAVIANGLLYRAGGHLILELRSKVAL